MTQQFEVFLMRTLFHLLFASENPFQPVGFVVDGGELPLPLDVVKEWSEIKSVIVGRVRLGVVGGRHYRRFVTVDAVHSEKVLDFIRDL